MKKNILILVVAFTMMIVVFTAGIAFAAGNPQAASKWTEIFFPQGFAFHLVDKNGTDKQLTVSKDRPIILYDNSMYFSIRELTDMLGLGLVYDGDKKEVRIYEGSIPAGKEEKTTSQDARTYQNNRYGFQIDFPSSWPKEELSHNGDGATVKGPGNGDYWNGELPEYQLTVFASHYDKSIVQQSYPWALNPNNKHAYDKVTQLKLNNGDTAWLRETGDDFPTRLTAVIIKDNIVYVIDGSIAHIGEDHKVYDEEKDIMIKTMQSFQILSIGEEKKPAEQSTDKPVSQILHGQEGKTSQPQPAPKPQMQAEETTSNVDSLSSDEIRTLYDKLKDNRLKFSDASMNRLVETNFTMGTQFGAYVTTVKTGANSSQTMNTLGNTWLKNWETDRATLASLNNPDMDGFINIIDQVYDKGLAIVSKDVSQVTDQEWSDLNDMLINASNYRRKIVVKQRWDEIQAILHSVTPPKPCTHRTEAHPNCGVNEQPYKPSNGQDTPRI